jgi:hypothetical protein
MGLTRIAGATDAQVKAALMLACIDLDSAMRYQGAKYDLDGAITGVPQEREFPRWRDGVPSWNNGVASTNPYLAAPPYGTWPTLVWDWDPTTNTAVVPDQVKLAECLQAESILAGDREERLQAIADGVVSQQVGSLAESYAGGRNGAAAATEASPLCERAKRIMQKYRLRSGRLL